MVNSKEIYDARASLRRIYKEYAKELYEITLKIDKYLETLEESKKGVEYGD
ncbi:MAG TPA: hypothetical protein VJ438_05385 [Candidatus Nanoarchaeia archaeon]|nr:hypothetical protein [Candidatus Nanoarchaeia archaeon]